MGCLDAYDLSAAGEQRMQARVEQVLGDLGVMVEASNQARVHTWYPTHFGQPYEALRSVEDGIQRFLVPATCMAVRPGAVYAPNGLRLLYEGVLGSYSSHVPVVCTTGGTPSATFTPGALNRYYLVVPHNGTSEGSYGTGQGNLERSASASACRPRQVAACP